VKKEFNHIEDIFKDAFDGFEANVDPSVWSTIQSNIGTGNGATPNHPVSSIASSTSKAILTKFIAGAAIFAGLATATYYLIIDDTTQEKNNSTVENSNTLSQEIAIKDAAKVDEVNTSSSDIQVKNNEQTNGSTSPVMPIAIGTKNNVNEEKTSKNNINNEESITENKVAEKSTSTQQNNTPTEKQNTQENQKNTERKVAEPINLMVKIKANTLKGKAPLDVEFNVEGNAVAYSWDFGDGSAISSQENSFHTFSNPGKYTIKLTAIDKNANAKTVLQVITVESNHSSSLSAVPTVFSPNGDGINDIIKIDGENIKEFTALVRDAKGDLVFEWKSLEGFWDGRDLNNQLLPQGVYYIVVVAIGEDGENHTIKQRIQLF
jgi:gliding motility-associated-like protein